MNIEEIYKKYKIPPNLRLHQLRVAAVAKLIVENWIGEEEIDEDVIITACLLHDMGNIIKFNLEIFPEYLEPEGYDYWKSIQNEFVEKYGNDEHKATFQIAEEIGVSEKVTEILESWGFSNGRETARSTSYEAKISRYADQRVDVDGAKSMQERHQKSRDRYRKRKNFKHLTDKDEFEVLAKSWKEIGKQIFENCKIDPEDITDEKINPIVETLWTRNI
ncbi:HD domain-containing protein [Candidatus Dojkabacteria bacterium]|nr:HD domain-containing protein [Candidatus Dojkabacteria bacterium]